MDRIYDLKCGKLHWNFESKDPGFSKTSGLSDNNLFIPGLWNMKDTVGHDDCCVVLDVESEEAFSFTTFNGMRYSMTADKSSVCLKEKRIVK